MLLPVRFLYVNKCLVQDSRLCLHRPIAAVFVCGVCVGDTWNFTGNYLEFLRGILFFIVLPIHKLDPRDKIILYHYTEKKCKSQQHPKDFPGGHPPQYYPGLPPLNFRVRMGSGAFDAVWPLTKT